MSMPKLEELRQRARALQDAREYLGKIGRPQKTTARDVGKLHGISVNSKVHYQPTDGATNYHECTAFDVALSHVVKDEWRSLAALALKRLQGEYEDAIREAKAEYSSMFHEVIGAVSDAAEVDS